MHEEIVDRAEAARVGAARAEHSSAVQPLRPMNDILLGGDTPGTAVGRHLLHKRLWQLLQEGRDLGKHGIDGLRGRQPCVGAADRIGLARQRASGRSRV